MAAPRATQFIALRNLSRSALQAHQIARARPAAATTARTFTSSKPKHASHDASTIDFFYFPSIDMNEDSAHQKLRVPILPDNYDPPRTGAHAPEPELIVHKPEINVMSMDSVILPFAENHDGHGDGVDFHAMADRIAANVRNMKVPAEEQASIMKQLWNDMVDDLMGKKKPAA